VTHALGTVALYATSVAAIFAVAIHVSHCRTRGKEQR
jgi:hypothetical protein